MRRTIRLIIIAAALLAAAPPPGFAQTFVTTGRDTLRGLPGVEVAIENLEADVTADGLTIPAIQSDVVGRLQRAGVPVYSSQVANPSPAKAYVYVRVNNLKLPAAGVYAMSVDVQIRQTVRSLVSTSNIVDAVTWDHADVVVVPVARAADVRMVINEFVDDFIQDWKAVH